jgi:CRP-like cAMP-binding protein
MASFHETLFEASRDYPVQKVSAGEYVFEQGSRSELLFVLIEGKVEVLKEGEMVAEVSQPGDVLGDVSVLLHTSHTNSVRAVRDSSFHVVSDPRPFLERNPAVALHLCELLARRLVAATEYLMSLKHQFAGNDHLELADEVLNTLMHRHPRRRIPPRSTTVNHGDL